MIKIGDLNLVDCYQESNRIGLIYVESKEVWSRYADNKVSYTTTDNNPININVTSSSTFGALLGANTYSNNSGTLTFKGTVTTIGDPDYTGTATQAFGGITNLSTVTIPSNITTIGSRAFQNCTNLSLADLDDLDLTKIGSYAFANTGLTSVYISDTTSTLTIERYAFTNCANLESVTIGLFIDELTAMIGVSAFQGCTSLQEITINSSNITIRENAFYNCTGLTSIVCTTATPPNLFSTSALSETNNCPIYVPAQAVNIYKSATNWSNYSSRIRAIE